MTRVRKAAAVAALTPLAAATIAIGASPPADAASGCWPLAHASINAPSGALTAGSSVHVSAQISGMLLQAHVRISGPGLDQQVGASGSDGTIGGDVTIRQAGYFTLAVIGNGTGCTYATRGFSVKDRPSSPKPTRHTPGHAHAPVNGSVAASPGPGTLPFGKAGKGGNGSGFKPFDNTPFSLPSVAPDGAAPGFQYPTPEPQVASPPAKPRAHEVASTTPITWGRSIAVALVLLLLSAHLGMLSRRQRLAGGGARVRRGGKDAAGSTMRRPAAGVTEASMPGAEDAGEDPKPAAGVTEASMPGAEDAGEDPKPASAVGRTYRGRRRWRG